MANETPKAKRKVAPPRPIFVIYGTDEAGEFQVDTITKNAVEVLEKCEGTGLRYKKVEGVVLGR